MLSMLMRQNEITVPLWALPLCVWPGMRLVLIVPLTKLVCTDVDSCSVMDVVTSLVGQVVVTAPSCVLILSPVGVVTVNKISDSCLMCDSKSSFVAGLKSARDFLEPIKAKYPGMSYADLWTLAGAHYVEKSGGPKINWRPGRTDSPNPTTVTDGRLPNADCGAPSANVAHIRQVFGRMGFSDQEMVALIGAHALGRCHTDASGYTGPWTRAETTFSNEFFR
jgi:hypothetical protein